MVNCRAAFERECDHRPRRDVLDEPGVERLALVLGEWRCASSGVTWSIFAATTLRPFRSNREKNLPYYASAIVRLHESKGPLDSPFGHRPAEPVRG